MARIFIAGSSDGLGLALARSLLRVAATRLRFASCDITDPSASMKAVQDMAVDSVTATIDQSADRHYRE